MVQSHVQTNTQIRIDNRTNVCLCAHWRGQQAFCCRKFLSARRLFVADTTRVESKRKAQIAALNGIK